MMRNHKPVCLVVCAVLIILSAGVSALAWQGTANTLANHDGQAEGKKSYGGSGPMLRVESPAGPIRVTGIRVHGSRYGGATPPDERFMIYFLDESQQRVLATEMADYSLFERGDEQWVSITFDRPIDLPGTFWLAMDFRAHQRKGVYVSYDTSSDGGHSRAGLPGINPEPVDFAGDWMIEVFWLSQPEAQAWWRRVSLVQALIASAATGAK